MSIKHDERHGGAYDRGRADYWYNREPIPHYFTGGTSTPDCHTKRTVLTAKEIRAYKAGYKDAKADGGQKDWG